MKKIYLIHCWDGTSNDGWYPWIERKLKKYNVEVVKFNMPNTDAPRIEEWVNTLDNKVTELNNNIYFIGHSIGCQTIMRYLETKEVTKIGGILFVAPWLDLLPKAIEDSDKCVCKEVICSTKDLSKLTNSKIEILSKLNRDKAIKILKGYEYKIKNRILITGAVLSSDNNSVNTYSKIVSWIHNHKYQISSPLDTMKFKGSDFERYDRAMKLLQDTKLIIAEMSNVSTGQGMELQEAVNLDIPILVIAKYGSKISGLVKGCKNVKDIIYYNEIDEIKNEILQFIEEEK